MIIDFLKTKTSKKDLEVVLKILREFKSCESKEEYLFGSFSSWIKLEQLEEYLAHLVLNEPLQEDTLEQLKIHNK